MSLQPPDSWDEADTAPDSPGRINSSIAELRAAWIAAVRRHHEQRTGAKSNYTSKPRWDGGYDRRTGKTYKKSYWSTVVELAAQHSIDPCLLVDRLFDNWPGLTAPMPTDLVSPENLTRALRAKTEAKITAATDLRTEEAVFTADTWGARQFIPDPQAADRYVLNDVGRPLSPLFRYIAARLRKYDDIAGHWWPAARLQFQKAPDAYLAAWGRLIPDEIKTPQQAVIL